MFKKLSVLGLIFALLYISIAVWILVSCNGVRGEGSIPIVMVTFPWIFLFLNCSSKIVFYTFSVFANSVVWYFLGTLLQKLANRLFQFFG